MLTEYLIPIAFKNNIWFNMFVIQAYIGILVSGLYFGRDLIVLGHNKVLDLLLSLIIDFWNAITSCLIRIVLFPINIFEHIIFQLFPIKKHRLILLNILKDETQDEELHTLLDSRLKEVNTVREIRRLEKATYQYIQGREYI